MPDEKDILLKVGVDASEVAPGVAAVKTGMGEMNAATGQAGAATAEQTAASQEAAAAMGDQAAAAGQAAGATEGFGESVEISKQDLMRLAGVLASVDGQMAMMVHNFIRMRGLLGALTSLEVLNVAGPLAAIGALIAVVMSARTAMAAAKKQFDEVQDSMERLRQSAKQLQTDVAGAAAAAGLPVAATGKARAIAQRMEAGGLAREKAVAAAPYFVDEQGRQIVSDEEAEQITAGIQAGLVKSMEGATPEARRRALERARRELDRRRQEIENARQQYQAENERLYQDAALGGITEIQQIVEKETGLTGDAARARAETIQRQIKEGPRGGKYTLVPGFEGVPEESPAANIFNPFVSRFIGGVLPESWRGYIPGAYTPPEQEDEVLSGLRRRTNLTGPPAPVEDYEAQYEGESAKERYEKQYEGPPPPARPPARPPVTQPAPVTQTVVHETV